MASKPVASTRSSIEILVLGRDDGHGGDADDRFFAQIGQTDIRAIIGIVVVGIDADALGADRIVARHQLARGLCVLDSFDDFFPDEVSDDLIGGLVPHDVVEGVEEVGASGGPPALHLRATLGLGDFKRRARSIVVEHGGSGVARLGSVLIIVGFPGGDLFVGKHFVARAVR